MKIELEERPKIYSERFDPELQGLQKQLEQLLWEAERRLRLNLGITKIVQEKEAAYETNLAQWKVKLQEQFTLALSTPGRLCLEYVHAKGYFPVRVYEVKNGAADFIVKHVLPMDAMSPLFQNQLTDSIRLVKAPALGEVMLSEWAELFIGVMKRRVPRPMFEDMWEIFPKEVQTLVPAGEVLRLDDWRRTCDDHQHQYVVKLEDGQWAVVRERKVLGLTRDISSLVLNNDEKVLVRESGLGKASSQIADWVLEKVSYFEHCSN